MQALDLVHLPMLMERTEGSPLIRIGIIDGPVATDHPELASPIVSLGAAVCQQASSSACAHGAFVTGILGARRGSAAPALCPQCPLLLRPVFLEGEAPNTTPAALAIAIEEVIRAGARIVNLSLMLNRGATAQERTLGDVLDWAARQGVLVVAAAGNQGRVVSSALTRHAWVLPIVSCDAAGQPSRSADLSNSIGRHGLMAPGEAIVSLASDGGTRVGSGASFAAALATGTAALLWSLFPRAQIEEIKWALLAATARRHSIVPPLLNAEHAYQRMARSAR